jgi:hypothetical protein
MNRAIPISFDPGDRAELTISPVTVELFVTGYWNQGFISQKKGEK